MTTPGARPTGDRVPRRPLGLPPWSGWALAVGLPLLVTAVVWRVDDPGYRLGTAFIAAVAVVAALAGTGPGIVATTVGGLGFWYAVTPPDNDWSLRWPEGPVSLITFVGCCGVIVAVSHQRDVQARRRAAYQRRYRRLSDIGLLGVIFWEIDGRVTGANDAFLEMIGYTRADLEAGRIDWVALTPAEYHPIDAAKVEELAAAGYHEPYEKQYVRKDGSRVAVMVGTAFFEDSDREGISYVVDITERWRLEQEREELLASERRALAEAEAATRRLRVVAAASARLMANLEPERVLREVADVVVPELADVAAVFVPEGGLLRRARVVNARHPQLGEVLSTRFPVTVGSDSPVAQAFRTGRSVEVPAEVSRAKMPRDHGPEYEAAVAAMGVRGSVAIPLRVANDVLGVLTISGTEERGELEPDAVLAAEQIAERAAVALQKAQSFAEERRIATLMQRALLPDSTRSIAGHEVGTCYVPAAVGREIGGDWWDVLHLPEGRVGLIVGDVSGHGVHVAPSMAKLRHSIDGVLMHGASPAEAVTAASRLLEANRPGSYATAFVSVYDPGTHHLTYSRAGHPPPLVLVGDDVRQLDHPGGTLLGINSATRDQTTVELPDDFELIAFTDGLVEEPGLDYDDGVARLVRAARALPAALAGQPRAERLVADVVGTTGRDDVCVVMVRPGPPGGAATAAGALPSP
jgi:PAS domain S-box-containing protein